MSKQTETSVHQTASPCQHHVWQETETVGKYSCATCQAMGCCPGCLKVIPVGIEVVLCGEHYEQAQQSRKQRRVSVPKPTEEASRHTAGHYAGLHPEDAPHITTDEVRTRLGGEGEYEQEDITGDYEIAEDERYYTRRQPTSVRRYKRLPTPDGYIEQRGNRQMQVHFGEPAARASKTTEEMPFHKGRPLRRIHLSVFVGVALLVMIVGWILLTALGTWWVNWRNYTDYGYPRTFQTDAVVGHHDSLSNPSHFMAINLNRHVVIIEFPGGDASRALSYSGPTLLGDGQDLLPVTLTFEDRSHEGRLDLVVHIQEQEFVLVNDGNKFAALQPHAFRGGGSDPTNWEDVA